MFEMVSILDFIKSIRKCKAPFGASIHSKKRAPEKSIHKCKETFWKFMCWFKLVSHVNSSQFFNRTLSAPLMRGCHFSKGETISEIGCIKKWMDTFGWGWRNITCNDQTPAITTFLVQSTACSWNKTNHYADQVCYGWVAG